MTTETHEQPAEIQAQAVAAAMPAASDPVTAKNEQLLQQLSMLTLGLVQQREQLAQRERDAEVLAAEITQRRLRIAADQEELLRTQGAVAVLQQLQQEATTVRPDPAQ